MIRAAISPGTSAAKPKRRWPGQRKEAGRATGPSVEQRESILEKLEVEGFIKI